MDDAFIRRSRRLRLRMPRSCRNCAPAAGGSAETTTTVLPQPLSPNRARGVHHQPQLRALVRLAQRIASRAAREAALRADRQPLEADVLPRFVGAASQAIDAFNYGRLAADEPEPDAFPLRH